jgi:hypothetical protein
LYFQAQLQLEKDNGTEFLSFEGYSKQYLGVKLRFQSLESCQDIFQEFILDGKL